MAVMSLAVLAVSCNKEDQPQETPKEEVHPIEGTWIPESTIEDGQTEINPVDECNKKETETYSKGTFKFLDYKIEPNGDCHLVEETDRNLYHFWE